MPAKDAAAFIARVEAAWRNRRALPAGQRLTRNHVHIAAKLAYWRNGEPRHRQLARASGLSIRTVKRALERLRANGLLGWQRRVVIGRGWRAQISNTYTLGFLPSSLNPIRIYSSAILAPSGAPKGAPKGAPVAPSAPMLAAEDALKVSRERRQAAIDAELATTAGRWFRR